MTRPLPILIHLLLVAIIVLALPAPAPADEMVVFKNGRSIRADELELKDGAYRITTMSGGIMEVPLQLVDRVITCKVDREVEEQRAAVPTGGRGKQNANKGGLIRIPPAGSAAKGNSSSSAGGKGATAIPPRGGRSLGNAGNRVRKPPLTGKGGTTAKGDKTGEGGEK